MHKPRLPKTIKCQKTIMAEWNTSEIPRKTQFGRMASPSNQSAKSKALHETSMVKLYHSLSLQEESSSNL